MRIGCCVNMIAEDALKVGISRIADLGEMGFDYVELPLAQMMQLPEKGFTEFPLPCEACNNFFPADVRLTGAEADEKRIRDYAGRSLERAARLGAKIVVFGSSKAKNVPDGFPMDRAYNQIVTVLRYISDTADSYGITVAIEPLCTLESNIINTAAEGLELMRDVGRENIKLLVDYYHLKTEKEPVDIIYQAGKDLRHVHLARPATRQWPLPDDGEDYGEFFAALRGAGYDARLSVEAYTNSFTATAPRTLEYLRRMGK